jgi:hydroxymethylpyrimidine/phosphomethylpyrimidine kinase
MEGDARALAFGGSDPAGSTGFQTDVRTMTRVGVEATAVVTALATPEAGVFSHPGRAYAAAVRDQLATLRDVEIAAVKTGVLPGEDVVAAVVAGVERLEGVPLVVDLVTEGADQATLDALRFDLLPRATLVTATLDDVQDLLGMALDPAEAIRTLLDAGPGWALVKGASTTSTDWEDLLSDGTRWFSLRTERVGLSAVDSGATFAAALTAGMALGREVPEAAAAARLYVVETTGQSPNGDIRSLE